MTLNNRWRIGNARITKLPEMILYDVPTSFLFPQSADEQTRLDNVPAAFLSADRQNLKLSTHSWLLQTEGMNVLIDTATGNFKSRPRNPGLHQLNTDWLRHLEAAGVTPEEIHYVLLSHLHVDHVGWNTRLVEGEWLPTFANARYLFSAKEYAFYSQPENVHTPSEGVFEDSVKPVVAAGLGTFLTDSDTSPVPGFQLHRTPGHSHDHFSFSFTSEGETAFFWGDVMHHPLQVTHPHWCSVFCEAPEQARQSRMWAIEFALQKQAMIFTTHFAGSSVGRLVKQANALNWQPL